MQCFYEVMLISLYSKHTNFNKNMKKKLNILFSFVMFLIVLELLLRISGTYLTYEEKLGNDYNYKYLTNEKPKYHTWEPNTTVDYQQNEFQYINHYNDLGHRERDFSIFKNDTSKSKIIFLDDSFTEGDGAPVDSAWTKFFDIKFKTPNNSYLSYNAGVCGSDVFFNYIMLKEKLLVAKPKIVIEAVNNSDIYDVYYYGGLERFLENGTIKSPNQLDWEVIYAKCHIFRMLINVFTSYSSDLIKQNTWDKDQKEVVNQIAKQITLTSELCKQNNIEYYLAFTPIPTDIVSEQNIEFLNLLNLLPKNINVLDLHTCLNEQLDSTNIYHFAWKKNGHYNGKGYKLMGDCIYSEFIKSKM